MVSMRPLEGDPSQDELVSEHMPARDLATLLKVGTTLASSLDLPAVLQAAVESAVEVLGLETGAIYTVENDELYLGATTPPMPADFPKELRFAAVSEHPHIQSCLCDGETLFVPDITAVALTPEERAAVDARHLCTVLYVPLMVEGVAQGTIIVGSQTQVIELSPRQVALCKTLASEISLAVANAKLFSSLRKANQELALAYDETIMGWAHALEMRDHETAGHAERVTSLTLQVAGRLGVHDSSLPAVRYGAFLHDIGKMIVPDSILNKPGPLSEDEWVIMRGHPDRARELLLRIDYLADAIDIPYCHHERWDGTGYPQGLAGEAIPLSARIFAVIDVYDALTSDRPYRAAWTAREALDHIRAQSGSHFDPRVAAAFLEVMEAEAQERPTPFDPAIPSW